jgi:flagellar hook protein FlgE
MCIRDRPITLYFEKATKAVVTDPDTWNVYSALDDPTSVPAFVAPIIASLVFGSDGKLQSSTDAAAVTSATPGIVVATSLLQSPNGSIPASDITLDFSGATQYGSTFSVSDLTQSGYANGSFTGLSISETGVITASYSNGQSRSEGMIALATFRNPQGLEPVGGNNWAQTFSSGAPVNGSPSKGQFGSLRSGALEDSNVDLTAELVNMMTAQRAYQANAQTIKTQDQVMSTLVNLR